MAQNTPASRKQRSTPAQCQYTTKRCQPLLRYQECKATAAAKPCRHKAQRAKKWRATSSLRLKITKNCTQTHREGSAARHAAKRKQRYVIPQHTPPAASSARRHKTKV
ncbi:hypothetical protein AVEN_236649-1 [Araneus ventricosus]|uniref:Uncharacterized protein n=1 Tax=Araneus ventricosus TaxID=182803 RepID=A0A4Y2IYB3_ARAVE|nr:hypothetical protein AVEN_236649-1 [Araneus ventricosus]